MDSVWRYRRVFLFALGLAGWLCWDLIQAHNARNPGYRSFVEGTAAPVKSPATSVSIVRSDDPALPDPAPIATESLPYESVFQMVRRAVDLAGGLSGLIRSGDTVLIKPNLVQGDSSGSGGVTDVRVVKALVFLIDSIDHGRIPIIVGDGSPRPFTTFERASGTTQRAWKELFGVPGYQFLKSEALAAGIDFRLSNLNGNSDTDPWPELDTVSVPGGGNAQPQGGRYYIHRDVRRAHVYISVPVLKIHKEAGFTCALKNQIGIAPGTRYGFNKTTGVIQEGRAHRLLHLAQAPYSWQDKEIVDLSALARVSFVVVDALACLETDKSPIYTPDSSNAHVVNRVKMNTILAGRDPVAVDHVCCRMIGLNPDDIEHITLAERVGLGTNDPDSITVAGSTIAAARRQFKKAQTWSGLYGQGNRTWLLNGPYPAGGVGDPMGHEFIPDERGASPSAGSGGWSQPVYFINDQIMLNDYYGGAVSGSVVSYAFAYVQSPADQRAELWVGSDEALKIVLNGTAVYDYAGTRVFSGTENYKETVSVTLQKGMNRLLIKTFQSIGGYNFALNICDPEPNVSYRGNRVWGVKFGTEPGGATVVPQGAGVAPERTALFPSFPNPFNPATTIRYALSKKSHVSLSVYSVTGEVVSVLEEGERDAGIHEVRFTASGLASGVYFTRLKSGDFVQTRKILLLH